MFQQLSALFVLTLALTQNVHAGPSNSDHLAKTSFQFTAALPDDVVTKTAANLKGVFMLYQPQFDSDTRVVRELEVTGTLTEPSISMAIEKCVFAFCKTAELNGNVVMPLTQGQCRQNYTLTADLANSSDLLTDVYSQLVVEICYTSNGGGGTIEMDAFVVRSPNYQEGFMQRQIYDLFQMQVQPITTALQEAFRTNGSNWTQFSIERPGR